MTTITQKCSKQFPGARIRIVTLALFLVVFGASAALGSFTYVANAKDNTVTAIDDQVSFTATGTAVITKVTKLPGGLTQLDYIATGSATHLGNASGPGTRIQDNQGLHGHHGGQRERQCVPYPQWEV